jgi:hypothetical protein
VFAASARQRDVFAAVEAVSGVIWQMAIGTPPRSVDDVVTTRENGCVRCGNGRSNGSIERARIAEQRGEEREAHDRHEAGSQAQCPSRNGFHGLRVY